MFQSTTLQGQAGLSQELARVTDIISLTGDFGSLFTVKQAIVSVKRSPMAQ